jgi:hypothetical protein
MLNSETWAGKRKKKNSTHWRHVHENWIVRHTKAPPLHPHCTIVQEKVILFNAVPQNASLLPTHVHFNSSKRKTLYILSCSLWNQYSS